MRTPAALAAALCLALPLAFAELPPNPTKLSSQFPADAPPNPNLQNGSDADVQRKFDILSWQSFVALNWAPGGSGIIGKYPGGDNPTTWETYKAAAAVFQPGAKPPTPWGAPDPIPSFCPAAPANLQGKVRIMPLIAKGDVQDGFIEAFGISPLFDVNGNYTRYEIRMNQVEFNKILQGTSPTGPAKPWYIPANQTAPVIFPAGVYNTPQVGAVEVKAAWRQISQAETSKYHSSWAYITYAPDPTTHLNTKCAGPMLMGLVGLHIAHKTALAPQWVWSTFEHVGNAPDLTQINGGPYGYYNNPKCVFQPACADQPPAAPSGGWTGDPNTKNTPVQVIEAQPILPATQQINAVFRALFKGVQPNSVWQYYRLVNTQWPSQPGTLQKPTPCFQNFACTIGIGGGPTPFPGFLTNPVLETYFQQFPGNTQASQGSCMGCHSFGSTVNNNNVQSDFSFLIGDAQPPSQSPNPVKVLRARPAKSK